MDDLPKKHLFTKSNYLLDLVHLKALEEIAPDGAIGKFMSELCTHYLSDTPAQMLELDKALSKGDIKLIKQHSYKLKCMCMGVGATYMAELCLQIEKAMMDEVRDLSAARLSGEQLKNAFLVTQDQIQAYVGQLPRV